MRDKSRERFFIKTWEQEENEAKMLNRGRVALIAACCIGLVAMLFLIPSCAHAQVDMAIIATIESSNNPSAYNSRSGAVGMYQITQVVIDDYNANNDDGYHCRYALNEMYNEKYALNVADWYMNERIPAYLEHYHIKDTTKNRIWAYNAGIGEVRWQHMPKETKRYIKEYERLKDL